MNQSYPLRLLQNVWQQALDGQGQVLFFSDSDGARLASLIDAFQKNLNASCFSFRLNPDAHHLGYFPLIDILRKLYDDAGITDVEPWLERCQVCPANRPLWRQLLDDRYVTRAPFRHKEHVAQHRLSLEQDISNLLAGFASEKPLFVTLVNAHFASPTLRRWLISNRQAKHNSVLVLTASDPNQVDDLADLAASTEDVQAQSPELHPWFIDLPPDLVQKADFKWRETPVLSSQGVPTLLQHCMENHALMGFREAQWLCDSINLILDERQISLISEHRFELMLLEAESHFYNDNFNAASNLLTELVELTRQRHQYDVMFDAYFRLAWVALYKYRLADAGQMAIHAQTALRQVPDKDSQWLMREREWLVQEAEIHSCLQKRMSSASQHRLEALLPMSQVDDAQFAFRIAQSNWHSQLTPIERRFLHKALVRSLTQARRRKHLSAVAQLLEAIARLELYRHRSQRARDCLYLALRVCQPLQSSQLEASLLNCLGYIQLSQGQLLAARDTLLKALSRLQQISRYSEVVITLYLLAWTYFSGGNFHECDRMLKCALHLCQIRRFHQLSGFSRDDMRIFHSLCRFYMGHSVEAQQALYRVRQSETRLTVSGQILVACLQLQLAREESDQSTVEKLVRSSERLLIKNPALLPQLDDVVAYASAGSVSCVQPTGLIQWMSGEPHEAELSALPVDVKSLLRSAELEGEVEQLQQRLRDTRLLSHLSAQANAATDATELMDTICRQLSAHLDCSYVAIELMPRSFMESSFVQQGLSRVESEKLHQKLLMHKLTRGRLLINLANLEFEPYDQGFVFVNNIALPNYDFGDLVLMTLNPQGFDESVLRTAIMLAGQLAATLQRLTHERELQHLSSTDMLTGLTNRQALYPRLEEELSRARRYDDYRFCLAFLDLDNFKYLNDTFGHNLGDRVLQGFAKMLNEHSRTEDVVARLGGDEFVILFPGQCSSDVMVMVQRLLEQFSTPEACQLAIKAFTGQSLEISAEHCLGCSVGVVDVNSKTVPQTVDHLLNQADQTMYRAKTEGKNRASIQS